jgi:DivIVA domain-containing protein
MGIVTAIDSSVLIVLGVVSLSGPLRNLRRARSTLSMWSRLLVGAAFIVGGVAGFVDGGAKGVLWLLIPSYVAVLVGVLVPGILARRRHGIPWWRFWVSPARPPAPVEESADALDAPAGDLIRRIEEAKFATTRLRAGYDQQEVDVFLDGLIATLRSGSQLDEEELRNSRFATAWLHPGYDIQEVHGLLREIAQA